MACSELRRARLALHRRQPPAGHPRGAPAAPLPGPAPRRPGRAQSPPVRPASLRARASDDGEAEPGFVPPAPRPALLAAPKPVTWRRRRRHKARGRGRPGGRGHVPASPRAPAPCEPELAARCPGEACAPALAAVRPPRPRARPGGRRAGEGRPRPGAPRRRPGTELLPGRRGPAGSEPPRGAASEAVRAAAGRRASCSAAASEVTSESRARGRGRWRSPPARSAWGHCGPRAHSAARWVVMEEVCTRGVPGSTKPGGGIRGSGRETAKNDHAVGASF